ncbi:MAG: DNA-binding NarL/FixJ family response regulator [Candidatus Azotimanducaceae bacterium]|jgi:DNA-binding NarL/FixJ family response regulator
MREILILEDMPDTQKWLLESCKIAYPNALVAVAGSIAAAREILKSSKPDLALVDLHLPDGKGNSFIPVLLDRHPSCICVIVTIYADEDHLLPSLRAGAKGYILKDQSKVRIAEMLSQAVAGELPLSPSIATLILEQFTEDAVEAPSPLTNRESQVLALVASGLSTPDVAAQLQISRYTAEDHLKQIYRKLNISSRAEAALAARKLQLI